MKRSTVLVSDATRNPSLALIRELGRAGLDVRGADARRLPLGLHSRYSPAYLDYGASSDLSQSLLETVRTERPEVLLPVSTTATQAVSKNRVLFNSLTAVNVPGYDAFRTAMDNESTLRTCDELGIGCPKIFDIQEAVELLALQGSSRDGTRIVVKPKLDLGAARGVRYVNTRQDLEAAIRANACRYGDSVLQEFIPGDVSTMRLVVLLFGRGGQLLAHLTLRKILQWPMGGGLSALAVSTHEPELVRLVLPFFEHLGWQGPAEVELKVDARDGATKLIEVNPRVPSYMGFPERCGVPFASMLVEAARGEWDGPICPSYPAGVQFLRTGELLKVLLHWSPRHSKKARTARLVWDAIRTGARPASLDWTDPLPRVGKLLCELTSLVTQNDSQVSIPAPD